ncbi:MAG: hypothetical protein ACTSX8_10540, partial [Alphaproteobacteria bacterium]
MRSKAMWLVCASAVLAFPAHAEEAKSLLENGGFEKLVRAPGVKDTGGKRGNWLLKRGPQTPEGWTLSGWFSGELEVRTDGAPEGKHYLRVTAPAKREAHIYRGCKGIWPGGY